MIQAHPRWMHTRGDRRRNRLRRSVTATIAPCIHCLNRHFTLTLNAFGFNIRSAQFIASTAACIDLFESHFLGGLQRYSMKTDDSSTFT